MKNYYLFAALTVALTGCASTAKWEHPQAQKAGNAQDVATMALAECEAYAAGRAPMPQTMPYMPVPGPTNYTTTGSINQYGSYSTFNATTTSSGFASGYAAGANMGANIANAYLLSAAADKQEKLTGACMRSLGWVDTSTPEGAQKFKDATSNAKTNDAAAEQKKLRDTTEIAEFLAWAAQQPAPNNIDYTVDDEKYQELRENIRYVLNNKEYGGRPFPEVLRIAHYMVVSASLKR